jgi:MYXO-CTERM domain-containing protein
MPFDPAVAGGANLPPGVTAGPYAIPGRLEFENYDMGGLNVGYFTTDHIMCGASGYRKDGVTASLCMTSPKPDTVYGAPNGDVYYDNGDPALDGTTYPSATTTDVYIGAVRPGDWVNITVDVKTAGTYQVGSTWASGNGPPGKEGGNGAMELQVFVNGTKALDWKDVFPNYATQANFHNWKRYPNMGTVTLAPGLQVIKLDTGADPHLNLDYVQLSLVLPDGGIDQGDGSVANADGGSSSSSSGSGSGSGSSSSDSGATSGSGGGSSGSVDSGVSTGSSGMPATGGSTSSGGSAGGNNEPSGGSNGAGGGCGCRVAADPGEPRLLGALGLAAALVFRRARRTRAWAR